MSKYEVGNEGTVFEALIKAAAVVLGWVVLIAFVLTASIAQGVIALALILFTLAFVYFMPVK